MSSAKLIRTSHPSGSRLWAGTPRVGCPRSAPGHTLAPENRWYPAVSTCLADSSGLQARPACTDAYGCCSVETAPTRSWLTPEASQPTHCFVRDMCRGWDSGPIRSRGYEPTPWTGSLSQPTLCVGITEMPCSHQRGPGRVGCKNTPAPICARPSWWRQPCSFLLACVGRNA
jgi:hypothetical protein